MTYWLKQLNTCPKDGSKIVLMKSQYKSRFGQARALTMYGCPKCRNTFVEYRGELIVSPFYKDILKDYLNWTPSEVVKQTENRTEEKKTEKVYQSTTVIEYNGITYSRNNQDKWIRDGSPVFSNLQKILDELYFEEHTDETVRLEDKLKMADNLYKNGSYSYAVPAFLNLIESLDGDIKTEVAQKICEGYRLLGDPDKTVDFFNDNREKLAISADILTSVAAAYLDIGIVKSAKKMADHACNMYPFNKELPPNLVAVYEKINKQER